jgi:hypothetical protein
MPLGTRKSAQRLPVRKNSIIFYVEIKIGMHKKAVSIAQNQGSTAAAIYAKNTSE